MEFVWDACTWTFVAVSTCAVLVFEVTALDHEIFDNAVEWCVVVATFVAVFDEVFGSFWNMFSI